MTCTCLFSEKFRVEKLYNSKYIKIIYTIIILNSGGKNIEVHCSCRTFPIIIGYFGGVSRPLDVF